MYPHLLKTTSRALVTALLTVLALAGIGAGPASAATDGEVSWAVRTASNDLGADRQNYSYNLDPGGSLKDGLVVANHGKKALTLVLYAADGYTTDSGELDLETQEAKAKGVGAWLHTGSSSVTVPPGKDVEVPFQITLPKNATPGDHVGGIVTSLTQADSSDSLNVDRRLAVRVQLRVGGDLKPTVAVEDLHIGYSGTPNPFGKGDATITYTVHNTGNAILTARQAASLAGPFGSLRVKAGAIPDSPELLPGDSWDVKVPVDGVVPALRLGATVKLSPLVVDASGSTTPLAAVDTTTHAWAVPWTLLLLIAIVVALVVLSIRSRRHATSREDARVQAAIEAALREHQPTP
ncbi:MAG: hypothetical protein JWM93_2590 [Frankiales bacterium]|nr:hypothetical protein [Frankiales bacterium]